MQIVLSPALVFAAALAGQANAPVGGTVEGRVVLEVPGLDSESVGPSVVFLEGVDGPIQYEVPTKKAQLVQDKVAFSPRFLAIAAGQTVAMPNNDRIVHNVFSFSKPNEFDVGLYPKGETKDVTFKHPGVVSVHCSIHTKMNAIIFVAPSPYFAVVDAAGTFRIAGVPKGVYRLKTWCQKLPALESIVEVEPGKPTTTELRHQVQTKGTSK